MLDDIERELRYTVLTITMGARMLTFVSILAGLLILVLLGQYFAGTADYYLTIENPRPLDDNLMRISIKGWGFASESSRSITADLAGQGFADVRLFATRKQMLISFATFGFLRPVSVCWRGNAGQHPLGDA